MPCRRCIQRRSRRSPPCEGPGPLSRAIAQARSRRCPKYAALALDFLFPVRVAHCALLSLLAIRWRHQLPRWTTNGTRGLAHTLRAMIMGLTRTKTRGVRQQVLHEAQTHRQGDFGDGEELRHVPRFHSHRTHPALSLCPMNRLSIMARLLAHHLIHRWRCTRGSSSPWRASCRRARNRSSRRTTSRRSSPSSGQSPWPYDLQRAGVREC